MLGNAGGYDGTTYYLQLRVKDENGVIDPHFSVQTKEAGGYSTLDPERNVSGKVRALFKNTYTSEKYGEKTQGVVELREDSEKERYFVKFNVESNLGRNIMNSLCGGDLDYIKIGVYINKGGYAAVSVRDEGDQFLPLLVPFKELPEPELTKNKQGKVVDTDFSKQNKLFMEAWENHPLFREKGQRVEEPVAADQPEEEDPDGLPF